MRCATGHSSEVHGHHFHKNPAQHMRNSARRMHVVPSPRRTQRVVNLEEISVSVADDACHLFHVMVERCRLR